MLVTHLNNTETLLLCQHRIPTIGGHPLHLGTPREVFIKEFLENHIASDLAIGTGEIIDRSSQPSSGRRQHDIILYKRSYPRIYLGGGIGAYLNESVVATIEVKSTLTAKDIDKAVEAAQYVKSLQASRQSKLCREIANYVVAYTGPAQMRTVFGWIREAYKSRGLSDPDFDDSMERKYVRSAALNGVFLLGRGSCIFENDIGFLSGEQYHANPNMSWSISTCDRGSLALLFAMLLGLVSENCGTELDPWPYFTSMPLPPVRFDRIDSQY